MVKSHVLIILNYWTYILEKWRTCGEKITNLFFLAWIILSMLRSKWNMCRVFIHVSEKLRNRILHYLSNSSIKIYHQVLLMFILYPYRDTKEQTGCQVVFSHGIFYITELFWEILYKIICAVNCMKLILLDCRLCQIRLFSKHISLNFFTF